MRPKTRQGDRIALLSTDPVLFHEPKLAVHLGLLSRTRASRRTRGIGQSMPQLDASLIDAKEPVLLSPTLHEINKSLFDQVLALIESDSQLLCNREKLFAQGP